WQYGRTGPRGSLAGPSRCRRKTGSSEAPPPRFSAAVVARGDRERRFRHRASTGQAGERRLEARNYRVSLCRPDVMASKHLGPGRPRVTPKQRLRRLLRYTLPYRPRMWLAGSCCVLNKVFDLAPPALIGAAVDVIVQQENSFLSSWGVVDVRH